MTRAPLPTAAAICTICCCPSGSAPTGRCTSTSRRPRSPPASRARAARARARSTNSAPRRQPAQAQVLGDGQVLARRQLLVNDADPGAQRRARVAQLGALSVDDHLAGVGRRRCRPGSSPSVLLPAPFSPHSAWHEPRRMSKVTPSSARTPGKRLLTPANRTAGAPRPCHGPGRRRRSRRHPGLRPHATTYGIFRYCSGTSAKPQLASWRAQVPRFSRVTRTGSIGMIVGTSFLKWILSIDRGDADLAPQVRRLRDQHRRQALLDVGQLGRQRVDRDDLHLLRIEIGEQRLGVQRPAADHRPAADVGIGVVDADDLRRGVLRRLEVIEGADDLDAGVLGRLRASPRRPACRRLGAFWLPARIATRPRPSICLASSTITSWPMPMVVDTVEREPLRLRRIAVERHHRHAARHRVVDRAGDLAGVGAGDQDRARPFVHRLRRSAAPGSGRPLAAA